MEEEEAERLKKTYGDALYEEDESEEPATCKLEDESRTVELGKLNNIIEARAEGKSSPTYGTRFKSPATKTNCWPASSSQVEPPT